MEILGSLREELVANGDTSNEVLWISTVFEQELRKIPIGEEREGETDSHTLLVILDSFTEFLKDESMYESRSLCTQTLVL